MGLENFTCDFLKVTHTNTHIALSFDSLCLLFSITLSYQRTCLIYFSSIAVLSLLLRNVRLKHASCMIKCNFVNFMISSTNGDIPYNSLLYRTILHWLQAIHLKCECVTAYSTISPKLNLKFDLNTTNFHSVCKTTWFYSRVVQLA